MKTILVALFMTTSISAHASLITFTVSGEVTGFDGRGFEPFAVGQLYTATYTFESEIEGTEFFSGGGGTQYQALTSASFTIGVYVGELAPAPEDSMPCGFTRPGVLKCVVDFGWVTSQPVMVMFNIRRY